LVFSSPALACGPYGAPEITQTSEDGAWSAWASVGIVTVIERGSKEERQLKSALHVVHAMHFSRDALWIEGANLDGVFLEKHPLDGGEPVVWRLEEPA
jgi:hypothetical protein